MNQAILKIIDDKIYGMYKVVTEDGPQDEYYSEGQQALLDLKNEISSLPSDTQWIDKLEKELEEEDKDIDSLDDYYMGLSVGKTIMLNRVKREILPINN